MYEYIDLDALENEYIQSYVNLSGINYPIVDNPKDFQHPVGTKFIVDKKVRNPIVFTYEGHINVDGVITLYCSHNNIYYILNDKTCFYVYND